VRQLPVRNQVSEVNIILSHEAKSKHRVDMRYAAYLSEIKYLIYDLFDVIGVTVPQSGNCY